MEEYIDQLRNDSVYIKLQAKERLAGAIDVESLIKVLSSINQSYKNFLEIELYKNNSVKGSTVHGKKEIKHFIKENELLIVDLDFASFGAAISPNTVTASHYSHIKNGLGLKKQAFEDYKKDVFYGDYKDPKYLARIEQKYTEDERNDIFKPLISNIYSNPEVKFYYGKDKAHLQLFPKGNLNKATLAKLIPERKMLAADINIKDESTYAIYVSSSDEMDLFGKKPKYSKILATEKLEHAVYPYQLNEITVEKSLYHFRKVISAEVSYEDELYYITYPDLNIEVWAVERKEAEEAFNFMLQRVVSNIYLENDKELTAKARIIKSVLQDLIKIN